jgi:hypothetical protein
MDKPMPREQLADLLTAPTGDEKSYRQLVREGHREPGYCHAGQPRALAADACSA